MKNDEYRVVTYILDEMVTAIATERLNITNPLTLSSI